MRSSIFLALAGALRFVEADLVGCLTAAAVPYTDVFMSDFAALNIQWNLRLQYTPAAIATPETPQQVSEAVICASENNVKVSARSGGHSYASFSSGGQNGSLVVNLENLHDVIVNSSTSVAAVGGGTRMGDMDLAIYDQGQRALSHGTCPGIGVGGHYTHGGYGYESRLWGLAMDSIVALDVVLANGSAVHASNTSYPDVFYACRGAAEFFGIVTTFYLQTQPAPTSVIDFSYSVPNFLNSTGNVAWFTHLQDFALNASVMDARTSFGMYIDSSAFVVQGTFHGDWDGFNSTIAPELLRGLPNSTVGTVKQLGWIDNQIYWSGAPNISYPTNASDYTLHDDFYAKSLTVPEATPFTSDALQVYFDYLHNISPNVSWYSIINQYGGPGSAINNKTVDDMAYSDRSALWVLQHYGYVANTSYNEPFPQETINVVEAMNEVLTISMPGADFGAYLNYVDPSLSPDEAHDVYYGAELYPRLQQLKRELDPNETFWNPQAITF